MTATKTTKTAKDGAGTTFTLGMAAESVAADTAQATYLASPSTEALIEPMQNSGGSVTANLGTLNGAATAANQVTMNTALGSPAQDGTDGTGIIAPTGGVGIRGWLSGIYSKLAGTLAVSGTFFQATQPVSAASLPLPSGAATSANQPTAAAQGSATAAQTGALVQGAVTTAAPAYTTAQTSPLSLTPAGNLRVDGSTVTQPVSVASLPLPTGAAQDGTDSAGVTQLLGGAGIRGWLSGIYSKLTGTLAVSGTFWQATQPISGSITPLSSGDIIIIAAGSGSSFTRPANTTPYVAGYLVANSTTAGSVVPLSWAVTRVNAGNAYIRRATMTSTGKSITNAAFVLHLYTVSPMIASGDGAAWSTNLANWIGDIPITLSNIGTDVAAGQGAPSIGGEINFVTASGTSTIYGLISAAVAYTPAPAEVETVTLEVHQN